MAARKRVVVVGAGMAGLVAADILERSNADVTLLEASYRPGGRIWTVREGFSPGVAAELVLCASLRPIKGCYASVRGSEYVRRPSRCTTPAPL